MAFACLWVVAATVVAFLPLRYQMPLGFILLASALALVAWLAVETNPWVALAAIAAVVSMFRKPLLYGIKKAKEKSAPDREGGQP
ncbi:DUF2484 family protein [Albidovulum aquaemixtae]|nr:DUF2484 family protein [Defluviimonas aquaemixtae]